jgi:hypothetical protein
MIDKNENLSLDWSNFKAVGLGFEFLNRDDNLLLRTPEKRFKTLTKKVFN